MATEISSPHDNPLNLEFRALQRERESLTWAPWFISKTRTVVCAGCGPSLNDHVGADILDKGWGLICTNSAGLWARKFATSEPGNLCQIITDSSRLRCEKLDPSEVPTFVAPYYLTRQWLDYVKAHPALRILPMHFDWDPKYNPPRLHPPRVDHPSEDPRRLFNSSGDSVIFAAIQLAALNLAERIILIGVDFDYQGEKTHFMEGIDHRHPGWRYETHGRDALSNYRQFLEAHDIELIYGSKGGAIDVLPRTRLEVMLYEK